MLVEEKRVFNCVLSDGSLIASLKGCVLYLRL